MKWISIGDIRGCKSERNALSTRESKIIGSIFGIIDPLKQSTKPPFILPDSILTANARSAIHIVAQHINPSKIWMPSFLCDVMLKAVAGFEVEFYAIGYNLELVSDYWIRKINGNDLVVIVDYFGFPFEKPLINDIKARGGWILRDASQALLTRDTGNGADFTVYSPRKYLGVPDGGILRIHDPSSFNQIMLQQPSQNWWLKTFFATVLRREFDLYGGSRQWFKISQETDRTSPIGMFAMSELSKSLILHGIDYNQVSEKRRENYLLLASYLDDVAIFPDLPTDIVPLGFPVRLENRDAVRKELFMSNIYPPVHWPIKNIVPDIFLESHQLSRRILTIPCDQRYSSADMKHVAVLLKEIC